MEIDAKRAADSMNRKVRNEHCQLRKKAALDSLNYAIEQKQAEAKI
jgi:hypothetical protein